MHNGKVESLTYLNLLSRNWKSLVHQKSVFHSAKRKKNGNFHVEISERDLKIRSSPFIDEEREREKERERERRRERERETVMASFASSFGRVLKRDLVGIAKAAAFFYVIHEHVVEIAYVSH